MSDQARRVLAYVVVVTVALAATAAYTNKVSNDATRPIRANTERLDRVIKQRREDLVQGCRRSSLRIEASILSYAASAMSDGAVAADPSQSRVTRRARKTSSGVHWEAAAISASTLVDCARAYPAEGNGTATLDVRLLEHVKKELESKFGPIAAAVLKRTAAIIQHQPLP